MNYLSVYYVIRVVCVSDCTLTFHWIVYAGSVYTALGITVGIVYPLSGVHMK